MNSGSCSQISSSWNCPIAQHIQNTKSEHMRSIKIARGDWFVPAHNLTSGHDYCQFWAKLRNNHNAAKKSPVWSICCSLSFLNTNEQLIFMRFGVIRSLYDQS